MYVKRFLLFWILLFCLMTEIAAQSDDPGLDPLSYARSPSSAELGKYGEVPVGLFTGTAEINVPLYELRTRNLSIPISLNYRSNGLMVNKVSSNVGFDWSLFAGGVITRITNGLPDDVNRFGRVPYPVDPNKSIISLSNEEKDELADYYLFFDSNTDTKPDMYSFNFSGYSGQFYINENHQVITVPFQNLKIEVPLKYAPFAITAPDGVIYEFKASEMSGEGLDISATAYHLTKITHPAGDEISFYYKSSGYYYYKTNISDDATATAFAGSNGTPCPYEPGVNGYAKASRSFILPTVIDSIVASGYGKIVFETINDRMDVPEVRVKGFKVFNAVGEKIRAVELFHHFPHATDFANDVATSNNGTPGNEEDVHYRMFLDSIQIKDNAEQTIQRYQFEYNSLDELPIRLSYAQDHWGFFNGADNSTFLLASEIPEPTRSLYFSNLPLNIDRSPNGAFAGKGMLSRIVYPTGGYTVFEYEPHKNDLNQEFGGVRLRKQSNFDFQGKRSNEKIYSYIGGYSGLHTPQYFTQNNVRIYCYDDCGPGVVCNLDNTLYTVYWLRSNSINSSAMSSGYSIGYQKVRVSNDSANVNGFEEHQFELYFDDFYPDQLYGQFAMYPAPLTNFGWKSGQKKSEKYFNSASQLLKEITYDYEEDSRRESIEYYVAVQKFASNPQPVWTYDMIDEFFNVRKYAIISKWQYLRSKTIKDYVAGLNPVTTRVDYNYNNAVHAQLTSEVSMTSNGDAVETKMSYPQDYNAVSNFGSLVSKFIINKPVDIRTYRSGHLVSGIQTKYNDNGQPIDSYVAEVTPSLTDITFDPSLPYTFSHKISYTYDSRKLMIESKPADNTSTSYLWSYANTLPVAKIENAPYGAVESAVENLGPQFLSNLGNANNQAAIENYLLSLRNEINVDLPNAVITAYTHYPLIGLKSTTDRNGMTSHFVYDGLGRLSALKDHDQNIIKAIRYHYISPSSIPKMAVSPTSLGFDYLASTKVFEIKSNGAWEISSDQSWIHPSTSNGNSNQTIDVSVEENTTYAHRSGTITIRDESGHNLPDRTVKINQLRHPNYVTISDFNISFLNSDVAKTFQVTSNVSWEIISNQPWVTVSPSSGNGNSTITVTSSANTAFAPRVGTLTVRDLSGNNSPDQTVNISQEGIPSYINVTPSQLHFVANGESKIFQISANVSWSVSDNQTWLNVSPGTGTGNGSVSVTAEANSSVDARAGVISIADESGGGNFQQILINQAGTSNYITLSTSGFYFTSSTVDGSFDIASNLPSWNTRINYISGVDWLDDIFPASGFGNRNDVDVHVNQLPPSGQTWQAEIEVYNTSLGISSTLFVNVTN